MKTKHLRSIGDLETEVSEIKAFIASKRRHRYQVLSQPLFRGHADEAWGLQTTLERYTAKTYSVQSFNTVLCATACMAGSLTGRHWDVEPNPSLPEDYFSAPPNLEFMAHARHHGFPTPLLDWTQSLYVALFFAFSEARPEKNVAIFVYVEMLNGAKGGFVDFPSISLIGPYVTTHRRHFLQQGQYTVAVERPKTSWIYCTHEEALRSCGDSQDLVYKFTLPGGIKNDVLRKLQEMNINAYTLLGDENSLMSTLAFKELVIREEDYPLSLTEPSPEA